MIYTLQCGTKLPDIPDDFNLQLQCYPSKILDAWSEDIEYDRLQQDAFTRVVTRAVHLMYINNGIGLAAPQMGINSRFFVWDIDWPKTGEKNPKFIFNPVIWLDGEERVYEEGCLSIALDWKVSVKRASKAVIKGFDFTNKEISYSAEGLEAACWQHEIDHLDGMLIIHYDGRIRRELYDRKLLKVARRFYKAEKEMKKEQVHLAKMLKRGRSKK